MIQVTGSCILQYQSDTNMFTRTSGIQSMQRIDHYNLLLIYNNCHLRELKEIA